MKAVVLLAVLGSLGVASCGGESTSSKDPDEQPPPGGGDDDELCAEGCEATVAAQCSNGPDTQEDCEADCRSFVAGSCRDEYLTLRDCAEGRTLTCSTAGLPLVRGCEAEQTAFALCL